MSSKGVSQPQTPRLEKRQMATTKAPPLILAIDTTSEHGSLALQRGAQLLECREIQAPQAFSRVVFEEISALLARHGIALPEVDVYAAAAGPGSFTGVRVGLTAAKGLAAVHGKRVVPVSNLAATATLAPPGPRILIPVLDARRSELYAGVYERPAAGESGAALRPLMAEMVAPPAAVYERLAGLNLPLNDTAFCGPDVERLPLARFQRLVTERALATAVAGLAWEAQQRGTTLAPEAADANYVRRSDAEIFNPR